MRGKLVRGFGHWVMVCKEDVSAYERSVLEAGVCATSAQVHRLLRERALSEGVERMYVVGLDGRNRVVLLHELSRGGMHGCGVLVPDVLRVALMGHCSAFVLCHNHPSGDPTPSQEDVRLTRQLAEAGRLLDVPVHDHLIVGSGTTAYVSFAERGLL